MAAVTIHSDFGAQENKVCHCFQVQETLFPLFPASSSITGEDEGRKAAITAREMVPIAINQSVIMGSLNLLLFQQGLCVSQILNC